MYKTQYSQQHQAHQEGQGLQGSQQDPMVTNQHIRVNSAEWIMWLVMEIFVMRCKLMLLNYFFF